MLLCRNTCLIDRTDEVWVSYFNIFQIVLKFLFIRTDTEKDRSDTAEQICNMWGFHISGYEESYPLGYNAA
jgi:hypothetical protein